MKKGAGRAAGKKDDVGAVAKAAGASTGGRDECEALRETVRHLRAELDAARHGGDDGFREMVEATSDWLWEVDLDGRYTYVSPKTRDMLGYDPAEVIGKRFYDLMPPAEQDRIRQVYNDLLRHPRPFLHIRNENVHRDGHLVILESSGVPVYDRAGKLTGYRGIDRDVTTRLNAEEQLRLSEARFRSIVQQSPMGMHRFELQADNRLLLVDSNPAADKLTGFQCAKLIGMDVEEAFPALRGTPIPRIYRQAARDGVPWHVPRLPYDDGTIRGVYEVWAFQTSPGSVVATFTDISAREEAEATLGSIVRAAPVGIGLVRSRILLQVNDRVCEMTGYSQQELIGHDSRLLYPTQEDYDHVGREKYRQIAERGTGTVQTRWQRRDGRVIDVLLSSSPIDPLDHAKGVTFTAMDITDQKRGERDLSQARALLGASIEQSPAGILIADAPDGRIRVVNSAAMAIRGGQPANVTDIAIPAHSLRWNTYRPDGTPFPSEDLPLSRAILKGETSRNVEAIIRREDGQDRWIVANAAPVRNDAGEIVAGMVVFLDITDQKTLAAQFLQAQKMEAVGQLAGGVAHDFNNQLTVILGYCQLLLGYTHFDEETRSFLIQIRHAGERARQLTSQLLAFSRRQVLQPEALDLDRVLLDLDGPLSRMLGERIQLVVRTQGNLPATRLDRSQLEQAVMNLAINSRDAMPNGGRLVMETAAVTLGDDEAGRLSVAPGPYVLLVVTDNGTGMDERTRQRIFEPFFTTKDVGKGTGLGLSMVYGFVKQSAGSIAVESRPGGGTTFRLHFAASSEPAAAAPPPAAPLLPRGSETVLVAEDEPAVRNFVARVLRQCGYNVIEAPNARAARAAAENCSGEIHLLVTDVVMPGPDGQALAHQLKRQRPGLKVLLVSGYPQPSQKPPSSNPPVLMLSKPFSPEDLAIAVRRLLNS
jgi:PAS domain S-box-containing protein